MAEHEFSGRLNFGIDGFQSLGDVARVLGRVDRNIPKWIKAEFDKEAKKLRRDAAQAILREPSHGIKHTGLLREIAAGIGVVDYSDDSDGDGVEITTNMPEDKAIIPRGFDTTWKGWRHPVFGKKNQPWVVQRGAFAWWADVMAQAKPDLEPKVEAALERGAQEIADSAHERG